MGCACAKPKADEPSSKVEVVVVNSQKPTIADEEGMEFHKRGNNWLSKGAATVFGQGGLVDIILNGSSGGAGEDDGAGGAGGAGADNA
eukprot:g8906.t1